MGWVFAIAVISLLISAGADREMILHPRDPDLRTLRAWSSVALVASSLALFIMVVS